MEKPCARGKATTPNPYHSLSPTLSLLACQCRSVSHCLPLLRTQTTKAERYISWSASCVSYQHQSHTQRPRICEPLRKIEGVVRVHKQQQQQQPQDQAYSPLARRGWQYKWVVGRRGGRAAAIAMLCCYVVSFSQQQGARTSQHARAVSLCACAWLRA